MLKPRRKLTQKELKIKEEAQDIVKKIEAGEKVAISTTHLSEVVNVIETSVSLEKSLGFIAWVVTTDNIEVYSVGLATMRHPCHLPKKMKSAPTMHSPTCL